MNSPKAIITAFKKELKEIREECCSGQNLNYLYAKMIILLNSYADETAKLSEKEQQLVWKKLRYQLSPGMALFNKAWRELCRSARLYLQKIQA